jgi:hypothetical protein
MLIIVTFLDAAQLSWVRENLKSLPTWPVFKDAKKCSPHQLCRILSGRFQDSQYLP